LPLRVYAIELHQGEFCLEPRGFELRSPPDSTNVQAALGAKPARIERAKAAQGEVGTPHAVEAEDSYSQKHDSEKDGIHWWVAPND
jgi:hypothetical protein